MATAKREVQDMLKRLPNDVSMEDIQYHIYVQQKIDRAMKDVKAGRLISHDEVVKRSAKWLSK